MFHKKNQKKKPKESDSSDVLAPPSTPADLEPMTLSRLQIKPKITLDATRRFTSGQPTTVTGSAFTGSGHSDSVKVDQETHRFRHPCVTAGQERSHSF